MKLKRILLGMGIFILLEAFAFGIFYLIWITAPATNIDWLNNNYHGLFKYLIIGTFTLSTILTSLKGSISLSK
jgi:heme/copper-type cytochrome/quinol oxidase subunit 3